MTLDYVDTLYEKRQAGQLSDMELKTLYETGRIHQWTYERLLQLKEG